MKSLSLLVLLIYYHCTSACSLFLHFPLLLSGICHLRLLLPCIYNTASFNFVCFILFFFFIPSAAFLHFCSHMPLLSKIPHSVWITPLLGSRWPASYSGLGVWSINSLHAARLWGSSSYSLLLHFCLQLGLPPNLPTQPRAHVLFGPHHSPSLYRRGKNALW